MNAMSAERTRILGRQAMAGRLVLALVVVVTAATTGARIGMPASQQLMTGAAAPTLDFAFVPNAQFGPHYQTQGGYPQVYGVGGLDAVNSALALHFTSIEDNTRRSFAGLAQEETSSQAGETGEYATNPAQGVLYTDQMIVSVLVPLTAVPPGGTGGESWIAETLLVPSGRVVQISDLFTQPSSAMAALRPLVASGLIASSECLVQSLGQIDAGVSSLESDLQPDPATFAHFAVTRYGLTVGFPQGTISDEACGNVSATLAWTQLQPMLSALGVRIERGV